MNEINQVKIILLDIQTYHNYPIKFEYCTDSYYDVERDPIAIFSINLVKKSFSQVVHIEFTDKLYPDWIESPEAYGIQYKDEEIIGFLEVGREGWHNRLRVTELLILEPYRHLGYGTLLMNHAKAIARKWTVREIVLETQSCNSKAIDFYLKQGFRINGIDLSAYSNDDIDKKEVRLEMIYQLKGELP